MTVDADAYVLGVDSGGSGLRVALGPADGRAPVVTTRCPQPVRTGPQGIDADHLLSQLLPAVERLTHDVTGGTTPGPAVRIAALAVGAHAAWGRSATSCARDSRRRSPHRSASTGSLSRRTE